MNLVRRFLSIAAALLLLATPAQATLFSGAVIAPVGPITINNYNNGGTASYNQVVKFDTSNNQIDAHEAQIIQDPNSTGDFYLIGDDYNCGFQYLQSTPIFCGFNVYKSNDLIHWTLLGQLFNPNAGSWQTDCATGCFWPRAIWNAANSNFALWFMTQQGIITNAPSGEFVFTCTAPFVGHCTQQASPTGLAHKPAYAIALFVDPQAPSNAYVEYPTLPGEAVYIDKLNSSFTDSTGTTVQVVAGPNEGTGMFYSGGKYYAMYGSGNCAYCDTASSYIASSTTPQGTYGNVVTVNSNSCAGQPRSIDTITANGQTSFIYTSDQWNNYASEALAPNYTQPLSISAGSVNVFSCASSVTIPGLASTTASTCPMGADACSFGDLSQSGFNAHADVSSSLSRMQTFVSGATTLTTIQIPLGQQNACSAGSTCGGALNADPVISIVTLDGSNNPVTTLGSVTISRATMTWGLTNMTLTFNLTGLSIGTHYGIKLTSSASQGQLAFAFSDNNPYSPGLERYNNGGGWTTETNRALAFATIP